MRYDADANNRLLFNRYGEDSMDYYMHMLPGRIRIRSSAFRKKDSDNSSVNELLSTIPGVTSFRTNSLLGTLIINYDRAMISSQMIIHALSKGGHFPSLIWQSPKGMPTSPFRTSAIVNQIS